MLPRRRLCSALALLPFSPLLSMAAPRQRRIAYLVSDRPIPFWDILWRGVASKARSLDLEAFVLSAENDAKRELENTVRALREKVDGIVLSPTNSSAAVTLLKFAAKASIPVVIADIGTDGGEYVSYIASDNATGAYEIGKVLVAALKARKWESGSVGIIAIPQKRANGKARTAGFMKALDEAGIAAADLKQQVDFSYQETYAFARDIIERHPRLRALWLQGSDRYQAALDAIADSGRKDEILLLCFDAEPEFIDLIRKGVLVGAAMQQPFLMGEEAVTALYAHWQGQTVQRHISLPILPVSTENLDRLLPVIRRNVLGLENR